MGTLNPTTESSRTLISDHIAIETVESSPQHARGFIERVKARRGRRKPRPNAVITHLLRWWIVFCSFLLISWIEVRNNEDKPITYCMDEVLTLAVDLNVSNASAEQWIDSNITTQLDGCATHMEKNLIANCDPLNWSFFTRSILSLQAIEYALMKIAGDMVQQWIFIDNCREQLNITTLRPQEQCKETTVYTHCLENHTNITNLSTIGYGPFEQAERQGAIPQKGVPYLKHFVSRTKLNVSRVFQNVTCGCVFDGEQKKVMKTGHTKLRLKDVGWSALMALIFSCLYLFIKKCFDGSVKRGLLKIYDYLLGSIWHGDGGQAYTRRRSSFSERRDDASEPIPLQEIMVA